MNGYIYIISNSCNEYKYIGQTRQSVKERFRQHMWMANNVERQTKFYKEIRRIGSDKFSISVLEECPEIDLNKREIYYIAKYNTFKNGYNSTFGGEGRFNEIEIDTDEFIADYYSGMTLIDMTHKYGIVIQTVMKIRDRLNLPRERDVNAKSNQNKIAIIQYDIYFNPIKTFESIKDAVNTLKTSNYAYCYIKQSILNGNIAYGSRWQALDSLRFSKDNKVCYYNTIFDKIEHENNGKDIELTTFGTYKVKGIYYPDYVGMSAAPKCSMCGTKLNRDGSCSNCIKAERMKRDKDNRTQVKNDRIKVIRELAKTESLSEIGRILGVSANFVKKLCIEYNIEYKTKHRKDEQVMMVDSITRHSITINIDDAVAMIIEQGRSESDKYGIKAKIKRVLDTEKIAFGYYWYKI